MTAYFVLCLCGLSLLWTWWILPKIDPAVSLINGFSNSLSDRLLIRLHQKVCLMPLLRVNSGQYQKKQSRVMSRMTSFMHKATTRRHVMSTQNSLSVMKKSPSSNTTGSYVFNIENFLWKTSSIRNCPVNVIQSSILRMFCLFYPPKPGDIQRMFCVLLHDSVTAG